MRVSEVIIQSIVYSLNLAVNTVKGVALYIFSTNQQFIKFSQKTKNVHSQEDMNIFRICFERLHIACENFYFHINEKRLG